MSKHTPGPWTVQRSEWANAPSIIRDIDGVEIAEVRIDESPRHLEMHANAALIAAAPEMYEALKEGLENMGSAKFRVLAEKAIAKAEGK